MTVSPAATAELIQMPFGVWTRVGPGNSVLDGRPDPLQKSISEGLPIVKYRDSLP